MTTTQQDLSSFYGLYRVLEPTGVGLQGALRLNPDSMADDPRASREITLDVSLLELDSTSLRQIHAQVLADPSVPPDRRGPAMASAVSGIVLSRGKMHNPVTGSGGVLVGTLRAPPPPCHPQFSQLQRAFAASLRLVPLCSLSAIPLRLSSVLPPDLLRCQVPVQGTASLPPSVRVAVLPLPPAVLPTSAALQCIDVSRLLPHLARLLLALPPCPTVAVLGCGRAGLFAVALCRRLRPDLAALVAFDLAPRHLHYASLLGASAAVAADLTSPLAVIPHVASLLREGQGADLVLNCVNCRGTEDASVFCCRSLAPPAEEQCPQRRRQPGVIAYFSMATDFTRACLATDPTGKCVDVVAGAGVYASQCEDAIQLYRATPLLQDFLATQTANPDESAADPRLWLRRPSPREIAASQIVAFANFVTQDPIAIAAYPFLPHFLNQALAVEKPFAWYHALHQWSVVAADHFWRLFWEFSGIIAHSQPSSYITNISTSSSTSSSSSTSASTLNSITSSPLPVYPPSSSSSSTTSSLEIATIPIPPPPCRPLLDFRFFPGARLNHAENLLRHADALPDKTALAFRSEDPSRCPSRSLSFSQLKLASLRLAAWLQHAPRGPNLRAGDRVCAVMPNSPETVVAMLAVTSFGGVFATCSPDMGAKVLVSRLGQIGPSFLFVTPQYLYNGKIHDCSQNVAALLSALPSLNQVLLMPHLSSDSFFNGWDFINTIRSPPIIFPSSSSLSSSSSSSSSLSFDFSNIVITQLCDALSDASALPLPAFAPLPADHPVYILFTSGTTGLPKCIAQGVGVLLNHWKEQALHCDLRASDKNFCYTSTAWMLWHWLLSTLGLGATVQLYDGSPTYPDAGALWRLFAEERVTYAGLSARFLSTCLKEAAHSSLSPSAPSALRLITSTGSPLQPAAACWVYAHISADLRLCSLGGGTEINGCLALGCPVLPTPRSCELQCLPLGMDVGVAAESGDRVLPGTPLSGDLVCRNAFPSMPLYFLNDPDGKKYFGAYFERFGPDVWSHGDFAELTQFGGVVIHGRSDATLNPGGIRLGTGDYYDVVEKIPSVVDSIVVAQKTTAAGGSFDGDERVLLFVKLAAGQGLSPALQQEIRSQIRTHLSPKHVPALIVQVQNIPVNANMKKLEILTRRVIEREPLTAAMLQQLASPELLDEYVEFSQNKLNSKL